MADTNTQTVQATDPAGQAPTGNDKPDQPTTQTNGGQDVFPRDVVEALRAEAASHRVKAKELQDRLDALAQQQTQQLKDDQKWEALAKTLEGKVDELEPIKNRFDALLQGIKASNESRVAKVPADLKGLIPDYDDPVKLSEWLDANLDKLTRPLAPNLGNGAGSGERQSVPPTVTPEQQRQAIKRRSYVQAA